MLSVLRLVSSAASPRENLRSAERYLPDNINTDCQLRAADWVYQPSGAELVRAAIPTESKRPLIAAPSVRHGGKSG